MRSSTTIMYLLSFIDRGMGAAPQEGEERGRRAVQQAGGWADGDAGGFTPYEYPYGGYMQDTRRGCVAVRRPRSLVNADHSHRVSVLAR